MPSPCTGLTLAQAQAKLFTDGDDVPGEKLLGLIGGMMAQGLLVECAVHPGHYITTEFGVRAAEQYMVDNA